MTFTTTQVYSKQVLSDLYEEHSPGLFRYAYRLLGDQDFAEECVSETFSRFLHALKNGGGPSDNARAYLYRTAHNLVMDHFRRQPISPISLDEELYSSEPDHVSQRVSKDLLRDQVRTALLQLSAEQQLVIQLRFLEDWSHEEVAAQLGRSVEATRALQHRAMESLRRLLLEKEEE